MNAFVDFFRRKILRDPQARWNHTYKKGKWSELTSDIEAERIMVVRDWLRQRNARTILELGCGEGVFLAQTDPADYDFFYGTDVSDVAIAAAQKHANDHAIFAAVDMDEIRETRKYDAIVFNEAISFSRDINALLTRMSAWLNPGGCFIISIHAHPRNEQDWVTIHNVLKTQKAQVVQNERATWKIELLTV
jgi:2-polyprenyl-3-methyl-5-hydroxy-6-metoxy-1,4-benzoquinol methylase